MTFILNINETDLKVLLSCLSEDSGKWWGVLSAVVKLRIWNISTNVLLRIQTLGSASTLLPPGCNFEYLKDWKVLKGRADREGRTTVFLPLGQTEYLDAESWDFNYPKFLQILVQAVVSTNKFTKRM
jgi:hypothetical protein